MRISRETYNSMLKSVKDIPPESGGILGEKNGIIQFVVYDEGVKNEKMCSYTPNAEKLNLVSREWQEQGILFCGIFHTHFFGVKTLSEGDLTYIKTIMKQMPIEIERLFFPIVVLPQREIVAYIAKKEQEQLIIKQDIISIEGGNEYGK